MLGRTPARAASRPVMSSARPGGRADASRGPACAPARPRALLHRRSPSRGAPRRRRREPRRALVPHRAGAGRPGAREPAPGLRGPRGAGPRAGAGPPCRHRPGGAGAARPALLPARGPLLPRGRAGRRPRPGDLAARGSTSRPPTRSATPSRSGRASIIVGMHFGAIEMPIAVLANALGRPVTSPMEAVDDPGLHALVPRHRAPGSASNSSRSRTLAGRSSPLLRQGDSVGLVNDRDLLGGGMLVPFFGAPGAHPARASRSSPSRPARRCTSRRARRTRRGSLRGPDDPRPGPGAGGRHAPRADRGPHDGHRARLRGRSSPTPRSSGGARSTRSGRTWPSGTTRRSRTAPGAGADPGSRR